MLFQVESTLHELVLSSNGRHGTSVMLNCVHACSCMLFFCLFVGARHMLSMATALETKNEGTARYSRCNSGGCTVAGRLELAVYNMAVAAAAEYVQSQDVHHRSPAGYNIITGCVLPQDVCITAGQLICLIKLQHQLVAYPYT